MQTLPAKATQQQTKTYNSQLVLKTIYNQGPISRAEVARLTQLTRTTVSDLVTELQDLGLVEEVGYGPSIGGRSPILLNLVAEARHIIALDLGSDEFHGALLNLRNEIRHSISRPVRSGSGEAALGLVYELIDSLLARTDRPLLGIGIGTPGLVDTAAGVVRRAVNLEWRDLPLGRLLEERYRLPVYVANDSQVAALTETVLAGEQAPSGVVLIRVGHGVGAGIVLKGQLFQGDGFGAGEIGHIVLVDNGQQCRCGNFGCLETVVSAPAIARRTAAQAGEAPESPLHAAAVAGHEISLAAIRRAAEAGDAVATGIVRETGRYLGMAAALLVGTVNVRRIVLVGSVTTFGAPLLEAMTHEMRHRALPPLAHETQITFGGSGSDVVIHGASALLLAHELGLSLAR